VSEEVSSLVPSAEARAIGRRPERPRQSGKHRGSVMAEFDTVIKGGIVVDGTGRGRRRADIGIKDGVIAEIGRIPDHEGDEVLDATGMIVAPGFIDLHTHYDAQLFWDPYCTLSGWHGVTSVVIGNCGFGFAPVQPDFRERAMLTMVRTEAIPLASMKAGMPWDWVTFPEYLDSVECTPKAVNIKPFLPMNPVMIEAMGFERAGTHGTTAALALLTAAAFTSALVAHGLTVFAASRGSPRTCSSRGCRECCEATHIRTFVRAHAPGIVPPHELVSVLPCRGNREASLERPGHIDAVSQDQRFQTTAQIDEGLADDRANRDGAEGATRRVRRRHARDRA